jgi:uracil-DNA glycosylase
MKAEIKIETSWKKTLENEFEKPYFAELVKFVRDEYKNAAVYPPPKFIFHAFELCPFNKVRAVILGQDPYHGAGQARGLCFSVPENIAVPPSLQNIYKEIQSDLGVRSGVGPAPQDLLRVFESGANQKIQKVYGDCKAGPPSTGNLEGWAKQGVLLLNATLTVRAGGPGSHQHKGWEEFTDAVIRALSEQKEHLVFLLWGKYAQEKGGHIDTAKHLVLKAAHPSPFSANNGFFGCRHFSKTNEYLKAHGKKPVEWIAV